MDLHENLKGKTVVITGGSGILCREFAYAYAKQGMNVAVLGRTRFFLWTRPLERNIS